jgi:hypothetical protein
VRVVPSPFRWAITAAVALFACAAPPQPAGEDDADAEASVARRVPLTAASLPAWRAYILPGDEDLAYASLPWHVTFGEGLDAARAEGKPLLMWAMNGHPLGCT